MNKADGKELVRRVTSSVNEDLSSAVSDLVKVQALMRSVIGQLKSAGPAYIHRAFHDDAQSITRDVNDLLDRCREELTKDFKF